MKQAFLKRIDEVTSDCMRAKLEKRKIKKMLEDDLAQETYAKQLFIKQISEMKKNYI